MEKILQRFEPVKLRSRVLALGLILLFDGFYLLNCLSPYLGLKFNFSQTMYSGLFPTGENHLFFPKIPLFQQDTYVSILDLDIVGAETARRKKFEEFVTFVQDSRRLMHMNLLRYHLDRVCREKDVKVALEYQTHGKQKISYADACMTPSMRQYSSAQLYPSCWPSCTGELIQWMRETYEASE